MRPFSAWFTQALKTNSVREQELPVLAIIEAHHSEVWLYPIREAYGHGQGSGLSGEAESGVAGFRFAPFTAAD